MINPEFYLHKSDQLALDSLKAVPGFDQIVRAFLSVWNEKRFKLENMSCNLRINEEQLSKYYDMLPPICAKLGIAVPELYLKLDPYPNAYTYGDTSPFIVITSSLLETLPDELIPSVLAHECGHIACHHTLYKTMARLLINGGLSLLNLPDIAVSAIYAALMYWSRCSEFSADRAAAICDGSSDKTIKTCLRFAGFDKDILGEVNIDAFLKQAIEYNEMVSEKKVNKAFELMLIWRNSHPLNSVRALEISKWSDTDNFRKIVEYSKSCNNSSDVDLACLLNERPITKSSKEYIGKSKDDVLNDIAELGFKNVISKKITTKGSFVKDLQVVAVYINESSTFEKVDWFSLDSKVIVEYYEAETEEEIIAAHPGQKRVPNSAKKYRGMLYEKVVLDLQNSGFNNINITKRAIEKKKYFIKEKSVFAISINGQTQFNKDEWFDEESIIEIEVYMSKD